MPEKLITSEVWCKYIYPVIFIILGIWNFKLHCYMWCIVLAFFLILDIIAVLVVEGRKRGWKGF